jgi:hypothetical protein
MRQGEELGREVVLSEVSSHLILWGILEYELHTKLFSWVKKGTFGIPVAASHLLCILQRQNVYIISGSRGNLGILIH